MIIALGVVLRCISYARRSTLWTDEAATAHNVVERSLSTLLTVPLDYGQAAPKGFLLLEWLITRAFGTSDLAFRFVPFVSGIVSLFVFAAVARRLLTPSGALAAVLFFAVGYWFLVYSSDTHPYGLDLALSLAALLVCIDLRRFAYPTRRMWGAAVFGAVAVWFSNGTLIALFGLGAALGGIAWRERGARTALQLWPVAAMWGVSAALAAWVAVHSMSPSAHEFFDWAWRDAMVPVPRSPAALRWLWNAWRIQLMLFHGWWVDNPIWTSLYVALALLGFVSLLMRRTAEALLAASVVVAYVLVSMAKQYPYEARLVLAPIAVFVLGIGESIGRLADAKWGRVRAVPRLLALLLCVPPIYRLIAFPPPYQWTVTGGYLAQIHDRWQSGDIVYSTFGTAFEVLHGAPRFGLRSEDFILGPCDYSDPRRLLHAADALRGRRRAWVIVGPGRYFPESPEYSYLRTIGVRRDSLPVRLPGSFRASAPVPFDIATAYLFDLSDPTRLARTTADTYVLSPLLRPTGRMVNDWNCYGVWRPNHRESGIGNRESELPAPGAGRRAPGAGRRATGDGRRATGDWRLATGDTVTTEREKFFGHSRLYGRNRFCACAWLAE